MRVCGSGGGVKDDSGDEMVRARGAAGALENCDWACAAGEGSWCTVNWRARLPQSGLEALRMRAKSIPEDPLTPTLMLTLFVKVVVLTVEGTVHDSEAESMRYQVRALGPQGSRLETT